MICSFIHSDYFYSASSSPLLLRGAPDSTDTASEFHAEALQAAASEGLAQGLYVAAKAVFGPMTLRTKGDEFTNESQCPTILEGLQGSYPMTSTRGGVSIRMTE